MKNFIKIVSLLLVLALFILPGCSGCNPETSSSMKTSQVTSKSSTKTKSYQLAGSSGCAIKWGQSGKLGDLIKYTPICPYCGKAFSDGQINTDNSGSYSDSYYCFDCRRSFTLYISWIVK